MAKYKSSLTIQELAKLFDKNPEETLDLINGGSLNNYTESPIEDADIEDTITGINLEKYFQDYPEKAGEDWLMKSVHSDICPTESELEERKRVIKAVHSNAYLTPDVLIKFIPLSTNSVRKLMKNGKIPTTTFGYYKQIDKSKLFSERPEYKEAFDNYVEDTNKLASNLETA